MKTFPTSVITSIAPVTQPVKSQLGNKITVLRPISSTVMEKSVPRTAIVAVGVSIPTFCGFDFAICPEA